MIYLMACLESNCKTATGGGGIGGHHSARNNVRQRQRQRFSNIPFTTQESASVGSIPGLLPRSRKEKTGWIDCTVEPRVRMNQYPPPGTEAKGKGREEEEERERRRISPALAVSLGTVVPPGNDQSETDSEEGEKGGPVDEWAGGSIV